jgi:hypothetical protein
MTGAKTQYPRSLSSPELRIGKFALPHSGGEHQDTVAQKRSWLKEFSCDEGFFLVLLDNSSGS